MFILSPTYKLGSVVFLRYCYGNVGSNISKTKTTVFPVARNRADNYCNDLVLGCEASCKSSKKMLLFSFMAALALSRKESQNQHERSCIDIFQPKSNFEHRVLKERYTLACQQEEAIGFVRKITKLSYKL